MRFCQTAIDFIQYINYYVEQSNDWPVSVVQLWEMMIREFYGLASIYDIAKTDMVQEDQ